jgi:hypothetical protein
VPPTGICSLCVSPVLPADPACDSRCAPRGGCREASADLASAADDISRYPSCPAPSQDQPRTSSPSRPSGPDSSSSPRPSCPAVSVTADCCAWSSAPPSPPCCPWPSSVDRRSCASRRPDHLVRHHQPLRPRPTAAALVHRWRASGPSRVGASQLVLFIPLCEVS